MKTTKYTFDIMDKDVNKPLYKSCKYIMPGDHTLEDVKEDMAMWAESHDIFGFYIDNVKEVANV